MSTDQTPALARATGQHELFNRVPFPPACSCGVEMPDGNVRENFDAHLDDVARAARATVSAALHDPDDPDWLARGLYDEMRKGTITPPWEEAHPTTQEGFRYEARCFVTSILGEVA
jgi:hypothetical protein